MRSASCSSPSVLTPAPASCAITPSYIRIVAPAPPTATVDTFRIYVSLTTPVKAVISSLTSSSRTLAAIAAREVRLDLPLHTPQSPATPLMRLTPARKIDLQITFVHLERHLALVHHPTPLLYRFRTKRMVGRLGTFLASFGIFLTCGANSMVITLLQLLRFGILGAIIYHLRFSFLLLNRYTNLLLLVVIKVVTSVN